MSIIVVGMHRSGTSAITGLVQAMGAFVGEPAELLPARRDNPKGYFERNDVLAANRAIMQHHGCNWFDIAHYDEPVDPLPDELTNEIKSIAMKLRTHTPFVVKDPRFCLTLPYWLPHFYKPTILFAVRHPSFVAHSLKIRNDMPEDSAFALWEGYMRHAIRNIEGLPVVRFEFERLVEDQEKGSRELYDALSRHVKRIHTPLELTIDPDLPSANPPFITLTPRQQAIYDMAKGLK